MNTLVQDTLIALAALLVLQLGMASVHAATPAATNPPPLEEIIVTAPAPSIAELGRPQG
jgi:hypothetical protein